MENKVAYDWYTNQELDSRKAVYEFLVNHIQVREKSVILTGLLNREEQGNIQIGPGVVLPHLEYPNLTCSQVIILHLKNAIDWDDVDGQVRLVVMLALKGEEELENKQEISRFMRKLADEELLNQLLNGNIEEIF